MGIKTSAEKFFVLPTFCEHAGQKYRLIATKNGRLVLNK
jgi:hypothetical protein